MKVCGREEAGALEAFYLVALSSRMIDLEDLNRPSLRRLRERGRVEPST